MKNETKNWLKKAEEDLADSLKAPKEIVDCCVNLNPYYTITRYPDVEEAVKEETAKMLPEQSKMVLEWAKRILKQ